VSKQEYCLRLWAKVSIRQNCIVILYNHELNLMLKKFPHYLKVEELNPWKKEHAILRG
jgi:hypothetical protein